MYSYLAFIVNDNGRAKRPMLAFSECVGLDDAITASRRGLRRFVILRQTDMAQVYASHAVDKIGAELKRRENFGPGNI